MRLFIMDEADKLMEEGFVDVVKAIFDALPAKKQVMAFSATYPPAVLEGLEKMMRDPQRVMLCAGTPALEGVRLFYDLVKADGLAHQVFLQKAGRLLELLKKVSFNQCIVFLNQRGRAEQLSNLLTAKGWPAAYISGSQEQKQRLEAMSSLRKFQLRVLVSTDLVTSPSSLQNHPFLALILFSFFFFPFLFR